MHSQSEVSWAQIQLITGLININTANQSPVNLSYAVQLYCIEQKYLPDASTSALHLDWSTYSHASTSIYVP